MKNELKNPRFCKICNKDVNIYQFKIGSKNCKEMLVSDEGIFFGGFWFCNDCWDWILNTPKNIKWDIIKEQVAIEEPKKIVIDLLRGLTEEQKDLIKYLTARFRNNKGFTPLGFSLDIKTGDLYYFDKLISFTVPMEKKIEKEIIQLNKSGGKYDAKDTL